MHTWEELLESCSRCTQCELAKKRKNVVIGRGNKEAPIMLIGEGPGEQEDIIGEPFVGAAGKLLDLLLDALMFDPKDYYIANIVKCRPPDNRVPTDEEADKCLAFLRMQMKLVRPRIIVCLGATAAKYIVDRNAKISNIRGKWLENKGFYIMPTFHPAALLRDASKRALMFNDMKMVRDMLINISSGGNSY